MDAVKGWAAAICMAALAAAILRNLAPGGAMERMIKLVMGAFLICALIVPLRDLTPQLAELFRLEESWGWEGDAPPLESTVDNQLQAAARQSITNLVTAELAGIGIKCEKVEVFMDTQADGRIGITKVSVTLAEGYGDIPRAAAYLEQELGLNMEVKAHGGP